MRESPALRPGRGEAGFAQARLVPPLVGKPVTEALNPRDRAELACPGLDPWRARHPLADHLEATGHLGATLVRYAVELTPDDNGTLLVTAPDIPRAATFGEDREDALARAADAIETALMGAMAAREDIPPPRAERPDQVALSALTSAKLELYRAMRAEEVGKAALARRLSVALPQIDRLLDLRHHSRLDAIERAFAALGRSVSLVADRAA